MYNYVSKIKKKFNTSILLIIARIDNSAGTERVVANLANYFSENNSCSIAVLNNKSNSFYDINSTVNIIPLTIRKKNKSPVIYLARKIEMFFKIKNLIKAMQPKIIISTDPEINVIMAINKLLNSKIICIGSEHMSASMYPMGKFNFLVRKYSYNYLSSLVVLTNCSKKWLQDLAIKNIQVIPNPLIYPLTVTQPIIHPSIIVNTRKKTLLSVGRLHPQKGFDLLIPIFSKLVDEHSDWQLVILGEGKQRFALEQLVNKLELQSKVYIPGSVGNLSDWYQVANIFVLPSRYEGLPCALMEAMVYGLPTVSFDCKSGPADIITHGVDGLLVENANTNELTNALDILMSNKKLRQQFALKTTEVRERFSIENIGKQWNDLFAKLSS